jgi:hypothetical protein
MRVISGRLAELRVYLWHCSAVVRPGVEVPVFGEPSQFTGDLTNCEPEDLKLVIEEGRRQLDRQLGDLERLRSRGATFVTVGLAEIALLAGGASTYFDHGWLTKFAWMLSGVLVVLGLAGAAALLTARSVFARTDTRQIAQSPSPLLPILAHAYATSTDIGEETVRTRITVLRDTVYLQVLGALVYASAWPFTR